MPVPSDRSLLRPVAQGLAVVALLAGMALMAFAAGLALLGVIAGLPLAIGTRAIRQRLRGGSKSAIAGASTLASRLTQP